MEMNEIERRCVHAQASPCSAKPGIAATCQSEHKRSESSLGRETSVSNLPGKTAKEAAWPRIHAALSLYGLQKQGFEFASHGFTHDQPTVPKQVTMGWASLNLQATATSAAWHSPFQKSDKQLMEAPGACCHWLARSMAAIALGRHVADCCLMAIIYDHLMFASCSYTTSFPFLGIIVTNSSSHDSSQGAALNVTMLTSSPSGRCGPS